jgi:diguanylate cyclase (GGDEF)-like protein
VAGELASLQLASTDDLTGISNRRGFEVLARQALAVCERTDQPAALAMIDMDGFKAINDDFGHAEGDSALVEFANIMLNTFRDSDAVARIGGDEFCILLAGVNVDQAKLAVSRLRDAVERRNGQPQSRYPLQFSAGVAIYSSDNHNNILDLLHAADAAMFADKKQKIGCRGAG